MDWKKAIGWFIIIIMVLSAAGYIGGSLFGENTSSSLEKKYGDFIFYNESFQWRVNLGGKDYGFKHFPAELENLTLPAGALAQIVPPKVYLGYAPKDNLSVVQNTQFLGAVFFSKNIIPQQACIDEEGCPDIPLMSCDKYPGIILQSGEKSEFAVNGKCLILKAPDEEEMQKLTERLIYEFLGVMQKGG